MTLVKLWKTNPEQLKFKGIHQIISFAGTGKLGDGNPASIEFREYLSRVTPELLCQYATECLEQSFTDSGLALQDIVNEIGRRLGYEIEPGRYRGSKGEVGFDGVWQAPNERKIVVEVKTTDAYRLSIETVATYRKKLIAQNLMSEENSSILLVVGRQDTGEIEAQIRGSRYAWDVRLISVDALLRLLKIRIDLDSPAVEGQIREILVPHEFTRVDEIINLVFSTAEEIIQNDESEKKVLSADDAQKRNQSSFNTACVNEISKHLGISFTQKSRVLFENSDTDCVIMCAVSKVYEGANHHGYWFAFHPHQLTALKSGKKAFACFGCGSEEKIALIPVEYLESILSGLNRTVRDNGEQYWHIQIECSRGKWTLKRTRDFEDLDISSLMLVR